MFSTFVGEGTPGQLHSSLVKNTTRLLHWTLRHPYKVIVGVALGVHPDDGDFPVCWPNIILAGV
ncbi:MAG: hypothetical protein IPG22_17010 [Acidobacteria bacterium]|nr:hypothetical protein [Acidobacteriota bacterium]